MFQAAVVRLPGRVLPALAAAFLWKKDKQRERQSRSCRKEIHPYYNLNVTVLRARNIDGADMLSQADCYVQLSLPTASPLPSRTKVVYNSRDPEWNESFHYRIHSAVKNILELTLYDRDLMLDDKLSSVVFDIENIKPGQTTKRVFKLNPKDKAVLEVEFHIEESQDPPSEIITNGVLVVHPCICVEGRIKHDEHKENGNCILKLSVPGSYEKQISAPLNQFQTEEVGKFVFHADSYMSPHLDVSLLKTMRIAQNDMAPELDKQTLFLGKGSVQLSSLPKGPETDIDLLLSKNHIVNMSMTKEECYQELDIRLEFELSHGERDFLKKRKDIIAQSLKNALDLNTVPDEVPVAAVLGSGGGARAMTSFYGSLQGLQDLKLLDSITYLSGVSGSTWCMSMLYEDPDWSNKDLKEQINRAEISMTSSKSGAFSAERIKHCTQELMALEQDGYKVNFSDLWGLVLEYFLHQKDNPARLSDQQNSVLRGQNPYPIYAGVNVRVNINGGDFAEWCEFTPHEVGFPKYGAFIRTEDFGSEFFMGHLIYRRKEPKICFLQGVWGSAFAANLDEIWARASGTGIRWLNSLTDVIRVIDDCRKLHFPDPTQLQTRLVMPGGIVSNIFQDFFKSRFTAGELYNFTRGLYLYKDYMEEREFVAWKGNHLDAFPNHLTPMEENLYLVDGGFSINSPFPLVLQSERNVDIIFSFNYSWQAPFEVLHLTSKYCKERGIPFPNITVSEADEKKPKECYVFMDDDNARVPIVLHFPLVNDTFHTYKAPGILRETDEEKAFGNFLLQHKDSPYRTKFFTYEPNDFNRLVEVNRYNVLNNEKMIKSVLKVALDRRNKMTNSRLKKEKKVNI
ncbi:cytosolic phospholipase A2 zeta isoform X2 [Bufo gargarizans]|uniref:cytosolic phospholipase A2 zeta isoform X2 n=1 Tax=Bufo gargarizans TaxID=30331 RepID=UPI001CF4796A|nr:cytosolic phospholipase A2 zeta isoform X2 [Bufo gargarizans]